MVDLGGPIPPWTTIPATAVALSPPTTVVTDVWHHQFAIHASHNRLRLRHVFFSPSSHPIVCPRGRCGAKPCPLLEVPLGSKLAGGTPTLAMPLPPPPQQWWRRGFLVTIYSPSARAMIGWGFDPSFFYCATPSVTCPCQGCHRLQPCRRNSCPCSWWHASIATVVGGEGATVIAGVVATTTITRHRSLSHPTIASMGPWWNWTAQICHGMHWSSNPKLLLLPFILHKYQLIIGSILFFNKNKVI